MSVNLHPSTEDTTILEKLAGVPAGTAAEYQLWMASYPKSPEIFASQAEYAADMEAFTAWDAQASETVYRYHRFIDDGFGRISAAAWKLAVEHANRTGQHPATGHLTDDLEIEALLDAQGVTLPDDVPRAALLGIYWYPYDAAPDERHPYAKSRSDVVRLLADIRIMLDEYAYEDHRRGFDDYRDSDDISDAEILEHIRIFDADTPIGDQDPGSHASNLRCLLR